MRREDIDSILIASMYLTICKCNGHDKLSTARELLNQRIKKALNRKKSSSKPFNLNRIIFGVR